MVKIARRYRNGNALLDLIEEGNLGLIRAVEKFDPERGFRFYDIATLVDWPERSTGDYEPNPYYSFADSHRKGAERYLRTARELSHKLDHEPSAEEMAERTGCLSDEDVAVCW